MEILFKYMKKGGKDKGGGKKEEGWRRAVNVLINQKCQK
jgi:hypothetical protein